MSRFAGGQLVGRFAWPSEVTEEARRYTRESTPGNRAALDEAKLKAAREIVSLQLGSGFDYVTDGGVGFQDIFEPYSGDQDSGSGGKIDKYPGTRNSYYHAPVVERELRGGSQVEKHLFTAELPGGKRKAILPSPASLALASVNSHYPNLEELMAAFARVLKEDVRNLEAAGYDFIQLNESFLTIDRFRKKVGTDFLRAFPGCIDEIFRGTARRSCLYFHSGDSSDLLPGFAETAVTDIGFDFHTRPSVDIGRWGKNLILGLQNTTRKLPEDWLEKEPDELASRARDYIKGLGPGKEEDVFLSPSQDYDGLQTFPQAVRRLQNLARAASLLKGD